MKGFLIDDDPDPAPAAAPAQVTRAHQVRAALQSRAGAYLTTCEIADLSGLAPEAINGVVSSMAKRGEVERLLPRLPGRRPPRQLYRWRGLRARGGSPR